MMSVWVLFVGTIIQRGFMIWMKMLIGGGARPTVEVIN